MAGRLDTRRRTPPVRIGLAQARYKQARILEDSQRMALAAGGYGPREPRFASVPIRIRINSSAGPNSSIGVKGAKPFAPTVRKRGYPPITTLPGEA